MLSRTKSPLFQPADPRHGPKVLVIAELGVNHDGRVDRALELVAAAASGGADSGAADSGGTTSGGTTSGGITSGGTTSGGDPGGWNRRAFTSGGADAVKLQLFDPRHLLSNQARLAHYQRTAADDVFQMLDRLRLPAEGFSLVRDAARRAGLRFIVTLFSIEDAPRLAELDVDAVKIASPDAVNRPLLRAAAALGKPLLISTGTCRLDELEFAADLLRHHQPGGCLLQCVSSYPTPAGDAALGAISALADRFALPVGYSDHTTEPYTGALAVAAGACVIEKHLTWSRSAPGPDHSASFEPAHFAHYVALIRQAAAMLGPTRKEVRGVEEEVREISRQSLCARRDLAAGQVLAAEDLTVRRPGTGIPAAELDMTVGKRLAKPVPAGNLINPADLAA